MITTKLKEYINDGNLDNQLLELYDNIESARERLVFCIENFEEKFNKDADVAIFSTPGRTEICGNHTDHQNGKVMAGAISLDVIAVVEKTNDNIISLKSYGHDGMDVVSLDNLKPLKQEENTSAALIRGIAARITQLGNNNVGGFNAYTTSNVLAGSGLSSSAAFEVLVATICNNLYCNDIFTPLDLAKIAQYSENVYFGKPCGLMDQTACAVGCLVEVDFLNPEKPIVSQINLDIAKEGYRLIILNTGANHSDLTDDYASIPVDMSSVAGFFGKSVLRDINEEDFYKNLVSMRKSGLSDKALLRTAHFFEENKRVEELSMYIKSNDMSSVFHTIKHSGDSSFKFLQNIYSDKNPSEQSIALALFLTGKFLDGVGAYRVHGGGFAGTIQVFMLDNMVEEYKKQMENYFGKGCCHVLNIRNFGTIKII